MLLAGTGGTDWTTTVTIVTLILAVAGYFTQGRRTARDDDLKTLRALNVGLETRNAALEKGRDDDEVEKAELVALVAARDSTIAKRDVTIARLRRQVRRMQREKGVA